jgi:hypothetical protein
VPFVSSVLIYYGLAPAAQAAMIMNNTDSNTANDGTSNGSAISLPSGDQSWTGFSLLSAPDANSYPIAGLSYPLLQ